MGYEVVLDGRPLLFVSSLPKKSAVRIYRKLREVEKDPFHYLERLVGREEYKIRIGDYRVIVAVEGYRIIVLDVGHRKNIYD